MLAHIMDVFILFFNRWNYRPSKLSNIYIFILNCCISTLYEAINIGFIPSFPSFF